MPFSCIRGGRLSLRYAMVLLLAAKLAAADFAWTLPKGFPRPVIPAGNPMNVAKVELGRHLFYDKRMSVNGKGSCGSCHVQKFAFTDGRSRAQGATGQIHPRSSMSLVNVAFVPRLTWADPNLGSLEEQALIPMLGEDPIELGLKGHEQAFLTTVQGDALYRRLFPQAFPGDHDLFTLGNVTKAIAAFERSIVSFRSPYDRYRYGHDETAISESAKRGEILFSSSERARCFRCHGGWNLSGPVRFEGGEQEPQPHALFFNTGVAVYAPPNRGLFEHTHQAEDVGKFRAPSLRNIAVTAPYMHDGSLATLEEVIEHYAAGGRYEHPNKSRIVRGFSLTDAEKHDLIEFLKCLTDDELLRDPRWADPSTQ